MATTILKLKGTLTLGTAPDTQALEAQISHVGIPQTVTRDSPVTMLDGSLVQPPATYSYAISGQMLLDLDNPAGAYSFIEQHQGETMDYTFEPVIGGPTYAGTLIVDGVSLDELEAGKPVAGKLTWPINGGYTLTWPGGPLITVGIDGRRQLEAADASS